MRCAQGLGEIYEEDYVRAAGSGAAPDADEGVRAEARSLTKLLFAKLDALSHFQYAPKPYLEDLTVRADVPALAMEEVAPQARYLSPLRTHPAVLACTDIFLPLRTHSCLMMHARGVLYMHCLPVALSIAAMEVLAAARVCEAPEG